MTMFNHVTELQVPCQWCGCDEAEHTYNNLELCYDCYEEAKDIDESMSDIELPI